MKRLDCCRRRNKEISIDLDEPDRVTTYDGLESILNSCRYENESGTSGGEGCVIDSIDEDDSICSLSKDALGSFSLQWPVKKRDGRQDKCLEDVSRSPEYFYTKEKVKTTIQFADVETMKQRFAKLLLGEDISGGRRGLCTALALTNAITTLAASIFGELWKLEPLPEETKSRWRREMDWLLSPANYMVELVPAKQNGANGRTLEIMTPIIRADIHMNLPALRKLDSMLIESLDSTGKTEFWYAEGGSRVEGRNGSARQSKRWWFPSPRVPMEGLSVSGRKKLLHQGKMVHQVFKAAKSINNGILLEMHVPDTIKDALPKSGKVNLGEQLYSVLTELSSEEAMLASLNLNNEHTALQIMNQLEAAIFAWKHRLSGQVNGKSPVRNSWSLIKDLNSDLHKTELLLGRAEILLQLLKLRFPNLPHTFLDVTKTQYNKDIGHSVLESYSRVIGNLAFSILSRIKDILQEDDLSKPNSPVSSSCFSGSTLSGISELSSASKREQLSLIDQMKMVDRQSCGDSSTSKASEIDFSDSEAKTSSVASTPCLMH
ncbi:hypothetical protein MKX01_011588 [Papaver californicum]|nr:hypothetical protein MKX01_011588 [Papaver californicum]